MKKFVLLERKKWTDLQIFYLKMIHARESQKQGKKGKKKQRTIVMEQHVRAIKWCLKHSRVKI